MKPGATTRPLASIVCLPCNAALLIARILPPLIPTLRTASSPDSGSITLPFVIDPESGLDAVRNVGISGGKIRAISSAALQGRQTIDAKGLVVAPGFIDLHQHGQDDENYRAKARDGVTTALELEVGVADVDRWYGEREDKALINYGASVGHIPVRMAVMHDPGGLLPSGDAAHREATPEEMEQIMSLLEKGLRSGALAVGIGPAYTEAATNGEITQVFRVAAKYRASCHIHIRSGAPRIGASPGNFSGFEEAVAAAAITGAPLHIVHIQSTGGPDVAYELQMISEARSHGMRSEERRVGKEGRYRAALESGKRE